MSIHTTTAGDRCAPAAATNRRKPRPVVAPPVGLAGKELKQWLRSLTQMERTLYDMQQTSIEKREMAAKNRNDPLYGLIRETEPLDRKIYQVNGARPVSGGLPTLGKRAR
jgi:hypothetical protein